MWRWFIEHKIYISFFSTMFVQNSFVWNKHLVRYRNVSKSWGKANMLNFPDLNENLNGSTICHKIFRSPVSMKICSAVLLLFHMYWQIDGLSTPWGYKCAMYYEFGIPSTDTMYLYISNFLKPCLQFFSWNMQTTGETDKKTCRYDHPYTYPFLAYCRGLILL
jgi:hypothetical protein